MDNLYEIYLEQAKLMHQNPKSWKGHMIKKYMPQIEEIIKENELQKDDEIVWIDDLPSNIKKEYLRQINYK